MVIIKFWRSINNVTVAEGHNLRQAFWDLLQYYPDFFEKIADFELDELAEAVEQGYLTLANATGYDLGYEDEEGNPSYYSYTEDGIKELLFRGKDKNNYSYIISKF